jgi:hypothetical protein
MGRRMTLKRGGFLPGQTGNPGGRASFGKALGSIGRTTPEVAGQLVEKALQWLDRGTEKQQEYAHEWLANYVFGKPKESHVLELNVLLAELGPMLLAMTREELQARLSQVRAEREARMLPEPTVLPVADPQVPPKREP